MLSLGNECGEDKNDRYEESGDARVVETECRPRLAECDLARNLGDVLVKCTTNVVVITEDECLFELEPNGDDVSRIC